MKPHYVPVQSSLYYMQHPVDMVVRRIFPGGAKSGKIKFSFSKLRKQPFFAKNVTEKCQILKSIPPAPPSDTHSLSIATPRCGKITAKRIWDLLPCITILLTNSHSPGTCVQF